MLLQCQLQRWIAELEAIVEDDLGVCEDACIKETWCGLAEEEFILT